MRNQALSNEHFQRQELTGHVSWRVIATHPERRLQQAKDSSKASAKPGEILQIGEDEAGRLFMVVRGKDCNHNNDEREDVPKQDETRDTVEQVGSVDINTRADEGNEVG